MQLHTNSSRKVLGLLSPFLQSGKSMLHNRSLTLLTTLLPALLILSFSGSSVAQAPPPPPQWAIGEPVSPTGFFSVEQRTLGDQNLYEFTILNGTTASVSLPIKPSASVSEFPLTLDIFLSVRAEKYGYLEADGGLKGVFATLSPNPVILKSAYDRANLTITFTARNDAIDRLYRIGLGRTLGVNAAETRGISFYLKIISGRITTSTTTTTATLTSTTTLSTTLTSMTTLTSIERVTEPSTYAWVVGATITAIVLATVLLLKRRR